MKQNKLVWISVFLFLVLSINVNAVLTDNLVTYWNLDSYTGSNIIDSMNRNNGTGISGITNIPALISNGNNMTDTNAKWTASADVVRGRNDGSICYWLKHPTALVNGEYFVDYRRDSGGLLITYETASSLFIKIGGVTFQTGTTAIVDNNYHQYCFVYNQSNTVFYRDGLLNMSGSHANAVMDNTAGTIYWGTLSTGSNGQLGTYDEIGFWNRSLTASEVSQLYNGGTGLTYPFSSSTPTTDKITFLSQTPSDITAISLFSTPYINITYSYNTTLLNASTVELFSGVRSNVLSCLQFINGTCNSYNTTYTSISSSSNISGNGFNNYSFSIRENDAYSYVSNLVGSVFMNNVHSNYTSNNVNNMISVRFTNVSNATQFNIFEVMSTSSGIGKVYACNESYNFISVITTNNNCQEIGYVSNSYNHVHNANSSHNLVPYSIVNGRLSNGVRVTSTMYYIIVGQNGQTTRVSYVNFLTNTSVTKTSATNGASWTNQIYTVDSHLHEYTGTEYLTYFARAEYNDTLNYTSLRSDVIGIVGLNPQPPIITNPLDTIQNARYMVISYLNATPTVSGATITNYSIVLLNSDTTYNRSIISYNALQNNYTWDVYSANLSLGTYYIKVIANDSLGLSSFDIESFNLTTNVLLNISAYNISTKINTFNASINGTMYSTTTGNITVDLVKGIYNVIVDSLNLASNTTLTIVETIPVTQYNFTLYPDAMIIFTTYSEVDGTLITTPTNITIVNAYYSFNLTTSSGTVKLNNLPVGTYTVNFNNPVYSPTQYVVTMNDDSYIRLNAYLKNATAILFNYKDYGSTPIEGVSLNIYRYVGGSLTLVGSYLSDVTGKVQFYALSNTFYAFNSSKSGYQPYYFTLNPVLFTSYDIPLSSITSGSATPTGYINYNPSTFYENQLVNFGVLFSSPYNSFVSYQYTFTYPGGSISHSGTTNSGEFFNDTFRLNDTSSHIATLTYSWLLSNGATQSNTVNFIVVAPWMNKTMVNMGDRDYGMLIGDKVFLLTLLLIVLMGASYLAVGMVGALLFGGILILIMTFNGFIPVTATPLYYVFGFVAIIIIAFRGFGGSK